MGAGVWLQMAGWRRARQMLTHRAARTYIRPLLWRA